MSEQEGGAVPAAQKQSWSSFIKSLASATGDMSSLTAPSFILSPVSLVEFSSYWGEPADELSGIADGENPEERMLRVLKWFIMTLQGSYTRRETTTGSEKKPLNPILGEQFYGDFTTSSNGQKLRLVAEQVSHHPPITAFNIATTTAAGEGKTGPGVKLEGHFAQKTSFSGKSIMVKQVGHAIIRVATKEGTQESYLITLPKLRIDGLFFGSPYIELVEQSFIQASTGYHAAITYKGKGYLSGAAHRFVANVSAHPSASPTYVIEGSWIGASKFTKSQNSRKHPAESVFADVSNSDESASATSNGSGSSRITQVSVAPLEQQGELESRRVWKEVADGIRRQDFEGASAHKSKLENEQRAKRKQEQADGTPFQLRNFELVQDDPEYRKLAQLFAFQPPTEESYVAKAV